MNALCAAGMLTLGLAHVGAVHLQASPEAEVEAALQHYADLLRAMDDHGIAQSFTDDGEVVNPGQTPVRGPEAIEQFIRQFDGYHVLEYEIHAQKTTVSGQTAAQNGRFRQRVKTPDGQTLDVKGLFQADWVQSPGGAWRIRRMATSREEDPVSGHAVGTFDVKLAPVTDDAAKPFGRMSIDKQFHGDIEGSSTGVMLTAGTDVKNSAGYVGLERVTGSVAGRHGSFVLQHNGLMNRGEGHLTISIVPDSGTDGLAGISGTMTIEVTGGVHHYDLSYALPAR